MEWNFQSKLAEFSTSAVSNKSPEFRKSIKDCLSQSDLLRPRRFRFKWEVVGPLNAVVKGDTDDPISTPQDFWKLPAEKELATELRELEGNKMDRLCWIGKKTYMVVFICRPWSKPDNGNPLAQLIPVCTWELELHKHPTLFPRTNVPEARVPFAFLCHQSH